MPSLRFFGHDLAANYSESEEASTDFEIHYHNIYELYYFVDGDADYFVEGKQYHLLPNSILLLSPYVLHGVRVNSHKTYKRFSVHFDINSISAEHRSVLLSPFPHSRRSMTNEVYYTNIQNFALYHFCEALVNCQNAHSDLSKKLMPIYLEALLAQLTLMHQKVNMFKNSLTLSKTVDNVTAYINSHLTEKITLEHLEKHFYINRDHLNRLFRKTIGTTVLNYVIHQRVRYAEQLLKNGNPATEVATAVGFGDYSSFYRAYKKITGHSPQKDIIPHHNR